MCILVTKKCQKLAPVWVTLDMSDKRNSGNNKNNIKNQNKYITGNFNRIIKIMKI